MDNKAWYKRISTCFWFMLATLPLWFVIIKFISMWFVHTDSLNLSDIQSFMNSNTIVSAFDSSKAYFYGGVPLFLRSMFEQLLSYMGFGLSDSLPSFLSIFMAWFVWVYLIELMVDFITWVPRFFHGLMERGFKKL